MRLRTSLFILVCIFLASCLMLYILAVTHASFKKYKKTLVEMENLSRYESRNPGAYKRVISLNEPNEKKQGGESMGLKSTVQPTPMTYKNGAPALHNLPYLHKNKDLCSSSSSRLLYLIYVFTEPHHFEARQRIRKTWGSRQLFTKPIGRLAFMLGKSTDVKVQAKIENECQLHGDIVQEDFIESYYNLTFKGVMAFRWISENCKNVDFIVKVDDDHFLNLFRAIDIMKSKGKTAKRTFFCVPFPVNSSIVIRDTGKYYVHPRQLSDRFYPPYCSGPTWIATRDVIDDLYRASFRVPYVPIEDAYSTGVLARAAGNVSRVYEAGGGFEKAEVYEKSKAVLPLFGVIDESHYLKLWRHLINTLPAQNQSQIHMKYRNDLDQDILRYSNIPRIKEKQKT